MQITLNNLKKLQKLDYETFDKKLKGNVSKDEYEELVGIWHALTTGATTPKEYFERMVIKTYLPTLLEPKLIVV